MEIVAIDDSSSVVRLVTSEGCFEFPFHLNPVNGGSDVINVETGAVKDFNVIFKGEDGLSEPHLYQGIDGLTINVARMASAMNRVGTKNYCLSHGESYKDRDNTSPLPVIGNKAFNNPPLAVQSFSLEYAPFYDAAIDNQGSELSFMGLVYFIDISELKTTLVCVDNGNLGHADGESAFSINLGTSDLLRQLEKINDAEQSEARRLFLSTILRFSEMNLSLEIASRICFSGIGACILKKEILERVSNNFIAPNPGFSKARGLYKSAKLKYRS